MSGSRNILSQPFLLRTPLRVPTLTAVFILTASFGAHEARAQADDAWTPALSMQYRAVSGTAISPDGSRIAFVVREPLMEGPQSEYRSHIWMTDADGTGAAQWTRGEASAGAPQFSPDGAWLSFSSGRDGEGEAGSQVWALPMAGGEARQLTKAEGSVAGYRWSPDGTRIAFLMRDPPTADEKKAREEKRDVILVDRNYKFAHLYVAAVNAASDEPATPVRLTHGDFHITGFGWAPDGERIVFAHQVDPRINTGRLSGDLSTTTVPDAAEISEILAAREAEGDDDEEPAEGGDTGPAAVGEIALLVGGAGIERSPHWSPDGAWIAYVSTGNQPEPIGLGDVYVMPAGGGEARRLDTPNRSASVLGWSGDSSELLLLESLGTRRHVLAVPADGGEMRFVSYGDGVVGSVALTDDASRMAFTWQTPEEPWDVFVSPTNGYSPQRVSDVHADVPRPEMGRTQLVSWTSTEGFEIEGLLTYPVDYEEGERVPLILNVHGGPAGVFSQSFTGSPAAYMLQYFAQEGFAILRPNPRGSTGYGKDFRYANFQDWGYGDFRDLMSGVDHVIDMGVADPDRLLLMGWSYGGYMTSWAVTQTDRFVAASMGAGLPNLVSMTTTTDIQDYLVGHMGVEFWEDYERYERHSAMYHIANVVTPTQVIHGAEDLRVPFTQGQEFYRALDRRGVPTEMVVYPRTPHGPREPKFVMDVSERILTWFRKHLGSEAVAAEDESR
ncbi:MAG: S9 family peptidase [Gemmatimonadetes bacterium]|nr:S9 family peptidase [Candidatus Palauibacter australiensis]